MADDVAKVAEGDAASPVPLICACVCTMGRPQMLTRCLASLAAQQVQGARLHFIIVDNNPEPVARELVEAFAKSGLNPVTFEHQPDPGIPFARNAALDASLKLGADWIAFLDDDETADPNWLNALFGAAQRYQADVIQGRVIRRLPEPLPFWAIDEEKPRREGMAMKTCTTNNVIFDARLVRPQPRGLGLRFDETMRFTGGTDTDFFQAVTEAGARIVWSNEPVVTEEVPANRLTFRWQIMRGYRVGANKVMRDVKRHGVMRTARKFSSNIALAYLRGVVQLGIAPFMAPVNLKRFKYLARQGARAICSASGNIAGLLAIKPEPYRKIDGQ